MSPTQRPVRPVRRQHGAYALRMAIVVGLTLFVFGSVFGMKWFGSKMTSQYFDSMAPPPANITTSLARRETWRTELEAPGTLISVNGTVVTSEVGGIVTAVNFESGQEVAKGTPLVQLDSASERAELARLVAQAELAELNRKRREKLFGLEAISKSDYDAAASEANAAKAAANAQRARLAQKDIRAPFAGRLGIRQINVGEFLSPGRAIVTLQSLDPIDIDFDLPEQHLGRVAPGLGISVRTEAAGDRMFEGKVMALEPQVDAATRNFRIRGRLPNADGALRPGQFGRVRLELPEERPVVVIPRTSLDFSAYGTAVFVVQKRKADPGAPVPPSMPGAPPATDLVVVQRFVRPGALRGDFVAIEEGIEVGEEVATSGLLKLGNGQAVIVNNKNAPVPETHPKPGQG